MGNFTPQPNSLIQKDSNGRTRWWCEGSGGKKGHIALTPAAISISITPNGNEFTHTFHSDICKLLIPKLRSPSSSSSSLPRLPSTPPSIASQFARPYQTEPGVSIIISEIRRQLSLISHPTGFRCKLIGIVTFARRSVPQSVFDLITTTLPRSRW